jgi:hypothetical protein
MGNAHRQEQFTGCGPRCGSVRYHDEVCTIRQPEVLERPANLEGVFIFDLAQDGRE